MGEMEVHTCDSTNCSEHIVPIIDDRIRLDPDYAFVPDNNPGQAAPTTIVKVQKRGVRIVLR